MNKTSRMLAAAFLALGLAGCAMEPGAFAPQEITVQIRSVTGGQTTAGAFTGPFTLELWNDGVRTTHRMTYTEGTGWNAVKVDKVGATINALAYYGNTVSVTSLDSYFVGVTQDQSTEEAFNAADVMIATGTVDENNSLSLNFEHRLAKVTFAVTHAGEFKTETENGTTTTLITNLYVVTNGSSVPEVTAYNSATNEYSAYIPAGSYAEGGTFVKIDIGEFTGDKRLVAKVPAGGLAFEAGKHYTFNLTVGKDTEGSGVSP